MSIQLRSPTGSLIVGTCDKILATAEVIGFERDAWGSLIPQYGGGSKVHWDTQEACQRDGKDLYEDEDGDAWTLDDCTEVSDDDA